MDPTKLFNLDVFNPGAVKGLYDTDHPGGIGWRGFLREEFRQALLEEARQPRYSREPEYVEGSGVRQDVERFLMSDSFKLTGEFDHTFLFQDEYEQLLKDSLGDFFPDFCLNAVSFQKYRKGSRGITPHRDNLIYRNLVSVAVLDGEAPFYLCADRQGNNPLELEASPGSLILLRGPRHKEEGGIRPFHALGPVTQERYSLGLRQIDLSSYLRGSS